MNENLNKIVTHPATLPSACAVGGLGVGFIAGMLWTRRVFQKNIVAVLEEQAEFQAEYGGTDEIPEDVTIVSEEDETKYNGKLLTADEEVLQEKIQLGTEVVNSIVTKPSIREIMDSAEPSDDWDYEVERNLRDGQTIYVLNVEEFVNQESGWDQTTLTWYAGDGVLCDERDSPVNLHQQVVGDCLDKFGHGSGASNVVYIRNENYEHEYEVIFDEGAYAVLVLGADIQQELEEHLEHSSLRKFRDQD